MLRSTLPVMIGSLSFIDQGDAALVASVNVINPNSIRIELFGSLTPPDPGRFGGSISIAFGTERISSNIDPIFVLDDGLGAYTPFWIYGSLINNINTSSDCLVAVNSTQPLSSSTLFQDGATFVYQVPHGIEPGDPFDVYWGSDLTGPDAGTWQSSGNAIPETSWGFLALASALLLIHRMRFRGSP